MVMIFPNKKGRGFSSLEQEPPKMFDQGVEIVIFEVLAFWLGSQVRNFDMGQD